jgi:hypothetical protein
VNEKIRVMVSFPLGKDGPFHETVAATTTVGTVLAAAMDHFKVGPEPNVVWYLTAHGQRQPDGATVGAVAGKGEDEVAFRLVKEITQG